MVQIKSDTSVATTAGDKMARVRLEHLQTVNSPSTSNLDGLRLAHTLNTHIKNGLDEIEQSIQVQGNRFKQLAITIETTDQQLGGLFKP